jgi:hypothetical protein
VGLKNSPISLGAANAFLLGMIGGGSARTVGEIYDHLREACDSEICDAFDDVPNVIHPRIALRTLTNGGTFELLARLRFLQAHGYMDSVGEGDGALWRAT